MGVKLSNYYNHRSTSHSQKPVGKDMVKNEAGGYVFQASDAQYLRRFLLFGASPTLYISTGKYISEAVNKLLPYIQNNPEDALEAVVEASFIKRTPNNSPSLYVLAVLLSVENLAARRKAAELLPKIARTPTHLFLFIDYLKSLRGFGKLARSALANWYTSKEADQIMFYGLKYRQRNGWTHRDVLRLAHPIPANLEQASVFNYLVGRGCLAKVPTPQILETFNKAQGAESFKELVQVMKESPIPVPWEFLPTRYLNSPAVWEHLVEVMPIGALVRNLPKITSLGVLDDYKKLTLVAERLASQSSLHPMKLFLAYEGYSSGRTKSGISFFPKQEIREALLKGFVKGFDILPVYDKRILVALDHSGSMMSSYVDEMGVITCWRASVAMGLVLKKQYPNSTFVRYGTTIRGMDFKYNPKNLIKCLEQRSPSRGEGTNCSLPATYMLNHGMKMDGLVQLTDNMSWVGRQHPYQALQEYRNKVYNRCQQVILSMSNNQYSIADSDDLNSITFTGFDSDTPLKTSAFLLFNN